VKLLKFICLFIVINSSFFVMHARNSCQQDCFFVTCVNCSDECDDNARYKNCDGDYFGKTLFLIDHKIQILQEGSWVGLTWITHGSFLRKKYIVFLSYHRNIRALLVAKKAHVGSFLMAAIL